MFHLCSDSLIPQNIYEEPCTCYMSEITLSTATEKHILELYALCYLSLLKCQMHCMYY